MIEAKEAPPRPEGRPPWERRALQAAAGWAGPVLIVATVLVLLRWFAFRPMIERGDMARYWLPLHCFMGRALASGHIPGWDPYVFGGMPFTGDPQAGWMNLPAMALFTTLPCGAAMRWLVVAMPVMAGCFLYLFLRGEGGGRPAATVGGLVLGGALAASRLAISVRFPAVLAWTAALLWLAGKAVRAERPAGRLAWLLAMALAWGQLAVAHLGLGLALGTAAVGASLVARAVREGAAWWREVVRLWPFVPMAVAVNLAAFVPRLALLPRLSLANGYEALHQASARLTGTPSPPVPGFGSDPRWPLNFATVPGRYLGAAALLLAFAAFRSRRRRPLAVAFGAFGAVCFLGSLRAVASLVPDGIRSWPLMDQYLHSPSWTSFGLLLSLAVLAGLGIDAFLEASGLRDRTLMVAPALLVWAVLPPVFGAPASSLRLLVVGSVVTLTCLSLSRRWPAVAALVPAVVGLELLATVVLGGQRPVFRPTDHLLWKLTGHTAPEGDFLEPGPLARALRGADGRVLPGAASSDPDALVDEFPILDEVQSVEGYQSVQLDRYWRFVRAVQDGPVKYQYANLNGQPPAAMDLLQVNWIVDRTDHVPEAGATPVATSTPWRLYRRAEAVPRASLVFGWEVVPSADAARAEVARPGFDPRALALLEEAPGIQPVSAAGTTGSVAYRQLGPQAARLAAQTEQPAILLIRNVWDRNWHARVDGKPAPLLAVDSVVQGVALAPGRHVVELSYDDPSVGLGLLGSALGLAVAGGAIAVAARRPRRASSSGPPAGEGRA